MATVQIRSRWNPDRILYTAEVDDSVPSGLRMAFGHLATGCEPAGECVWSPCDPPPERDLFLERLEEQIEIEVQGCIRRARDVGLADIVLDEQSPIPVDDAARRILGRIIRAALRRSSATLTDDERTLVAFVCETVEAEVRNG